LSGAVVDENFTITCDATGAGWGEAKFDVVLHGRSLPHNVDQVEKGIYLISFTPQERGKHRIYVYYNGIEVKGTSLSIDHQIPFRMINTDLTCLVFCIICTLRATPNSEML
jgi:filamin